MTINAVKGNVSNGRRAIACLILLISVGAAGQSVAVDKSRHHAPIQAVHVLGFEGVRKDAPGELSIENGTLAFRQKGRPAASVNIAAIKDAGVGSQDKQVGGVPMALGKAAVPFGGGRLISLVSHKKFDTFTLEYVDADGGLHGGIFQLNKGDARILRDALTEAGAQLRSDLTPTAQLKEN